MEKLRRENESLKTELAMEFRQFRKPVDSSSADRIAQVRQKQMEMRSRVVENVLYCTMHRALKAAQRGRAAPCVCFLGCW